MILLYYFSTITFLFLLYFLYHLFIYFYFSLSFCHTLLILGTFLSIKWILVFDIWNFIFMWNCKMILLIVWSISLKVYSLHLCINVMIIIWMIIWINCTKYYHYRPISTRWRWLWIWIPGGFCTVQSIYE